MNKSQKIIALRILVSGFLFAITMAFDLAANINFLLALLAYLICGYSVVYKGIYGILHLKPLDENFLMTIATSGAIILGHFEEALGVMLFYLVGVFFENYAVDKSRKSIAEAMDIRPEYAWLIRGDEVIEVDPYEVEIGDLILIKPGERVPLDGVVLEGDSSLDTSPLTGESVYRSVGEKDEIFSGCINVGGVLTVRVEKTFDDSTVSKILELVETAGTRKSEVERFITKFAKYYTPIVVMFAVLLSIIPPLVMKDDFGTWIYRGLLFLVVSCPCALVISVPLSFFGGIGAASRRGIVVKGGVFLEKSAELKRIVFDKTGTLTKGQFEVIDVVSDVVSREELLELGAYIESCSNHPIAKAVVKAYEDGLYSTENEKRRVDSTKVDKYEEIPGKGASGVVENRIIALGNAKLMKLLNIKDFSDEESGTIVHVGMDRRYLGYIKLGDTPKECSLNLVEKLKKQGVEKTFMLTGDRDEVAKEIGNKISIDKIYSELLPSDKVEKFEEIMKPMVNKGYVAFVGDGINDAPVLARADLGIAMGGMGSDASIEASDVVIMDDDLCKIADLIFIGKKTLRIAKGNVVFALGVKFLVLILGALGMASMWMAIFADVGVSVIAVVNAMRTLVMASYLKDCDYSKEFKKELKHKNHE